MKAIKLKTYAHKATPRCSQEWLSNDPASYLYTTCPVHENEAVGGIDNRIIIRFNKQVKYYKNEIKDVGTVVVGEYTVGVYDRDKIWLCSERDDTHEVHLIRDGMQVTFRGFKDNHRAMRFVKGLKASPDRCEAAFNTKLAENIQADASARYPEQYSEFLGNALRDTLALSDEQAINECMQLIEIIKNRKNK